MPVAPVEDGHVPLTTKPDGVHFSRAGYRKLGRLMKSAMHAVTS